MKIIKSNKRQAILLYAYYSTALLLSKQTLLTENY